MKVTINDVARQANVSKSTVSRVINNTKPVSEEVRKRVLEVIDRTNFTPSLTARSLSLKKSHLIGIILPDLSNPVFSRIIAGIETYMRNKEYYLLITATDFDVNMKINHIKILKDKSVDGLILVTDHGNEEFYQEMINFKKPVIMVGSDSTIDKIPVVKIDNYKAACDATEYLLGLGHKKIAMIRGVLSDPQSGRERFEGFRDTLMKKNLYDDSLIEEGWYTFEDGYEGMKKIFDRGNIPSAVFCACDLMAIGAIRYSLERGFRIPEDISFLGFDDVEISRMYNPPLSTIRQNFEEIGRVSIEKLISMIEENDEEEDKNIYILPHKLIKRESTIKINGGCCNGKSQDK